ncbi:MAG: 23S rRNA (guanosine(2251)-2'-O)-methyltransferase RlmB [Acetobacteraceae bacterium]|nr:23S rRNA (guanosine(2251)-2'-O)-methyltransferase RlmB [Acetobacteraceae bacterium]
MRQRPARPSKTTAPWLHGRHAVAAALANPARRLERLLATQEAEAALARLVAKPWPVRAERTDGEELRALLGDQAVHQGLALLAEPLAPPPLAELLGVTTGPVLVLDQVTDPRNVGAVLRGAAAFGAAAVVVQDRHAPGETGVLARAAAGSLERVPMLAEVNLARALETLKQAGLWVVGLDGEARNTLRGIGLGPRRAALVLGAEGEGLRRNIRAHCDELARLPMVPGAVESLNVSVAAAVALYEITAAKLEKGETP